MLTVAAEKNLGVIKTQTITTTLFDLIACMQDHAPDTTDESLITHKVTELMRTGRLKFQRKISKQNAA